MRTRYLLLPIIALAACAPKRINEPPILETGDRVESTDAVIERARQDTDRTQREATAQRDAAAAGAMATCAPDICAAITRGEIALGMTEAQVMAATRTSEGAWSTRDAGEASVMVPMSRSTAPRDAMGELAMVQLRNGRVASYSYNESQGVRVVSNPEDATTAGRASALAEMLLREVWDSTTEWQDPATVTEHVRRVRQKIESDPQHPRWIQTIRGFGYRLRVPDGRE